MTNYEKAVECAENNGIYSKDAAMQMAEWKDQQFKEYLEKKKELFRKRHTDADSCSEEEAIAWALYSEMKEIINELFGII